MAEIANKNDANYEFVCHSQDNSHSEMKWTFFSNYIERDSLNEKKNETKAAIIPVTISVRLEPAYNRKCNRRI